MVEGREFIMNVLATMLVIVVICIILSCFADILEKNRRKNAIKIASKFDLNEECPEASLTLLRIHAKEQIRICEETADEYRKMLRDIDDILENSKENK